MKPGDLVETIIAETWLHHLENETIAYIAKKGCIGLVLPYEDNEYPDHEVKVMMNGRTGACAKMALRVIQRIT